MAKDFFLLWEKVRGWYCAMLTSREIFGYLLAVKGAALVIPLALLDGIRFFDSLSWLFWTGILLALALMFGGLALASAAEAEREDPEV